jgi:phytol kinase
MSLLAAVLVVLALLIANEWWWQTHEPQGELSRKFIHITVGSFVAFWPFFLSWRQIIGLSAAFLVVVVVSKYLDIFHAIHSVQRPTWGEICFALAVGLVALMTHDKWVYLTSLLMMSLGDGLAAVIGTRFGRRNRYAFLGHAKSVAGTLTFFIVAIIILLLFNSHTPDRLNGLLIFELALGASLIENIGVRGLDNLLVPLFIAAFLVNR